MRYYRCKCGKHTAWSSMGVALCEGCEECGTTLAEGPNDHDTPGPHDWREEWTINKQTGARAKERVCAQCARREPVVLTVIVDNGPIAIQAVDVTPGQIMAMAGIDPLFSLLTETAPPKLLDHDIPIEISDDMRFFSAPPGTF